MQLTKTHKIVISIIFVVILLFVYIIFDRRAKQKEPTVNIDTNQVVATSTNGVVVVNTQGTGSYTIKQVPITGGKGVPQPIPSLDRGVTAESGVSVSSEAIVLATGKILSLQARLKKNPGDFSAWLDLGMYQKIAGDYQGTLISWTYASKLAPTDYISLGNIGNLYAYFLKNTGMSLEFYKAAISKGPTQAYLYIQLAEIYRDLFKDSVKALATVDQGLAKIPNDPNLLQLKSSLSK